MNPILEISKEMVDPTAILYSPQLHEKNLMTVDLKKVNEGNINSFHPKINTQSKQLVN